MKTGFKEFLILELDYNNLDTKIDYHKTLNIKLWDNPEKPSDAKLKNDVKYALNNIANEFIEFLEIPKQDVKDIIITGSNASFNYVEGLSDIDLHIIVDFSKNNICTDCKTEFVNSCFQAKKSLWNSTHNITVKDQPVELYVQDANEPHIASGVWSLKQDNWLIVPQYVHPTYDTTAVKIKASEIMNQIDDLISSQSDDITSFEKLKEKIRTMRKTGLYSGGEYSIENLVFKTLRNNGYLEKLSSYLIKIKDKSLSLD
jgi:hypothetical protein